MATPIPANRASFSAAEILAATRASTGTDLLGACRSVVTDSRGDVRGALFVALVGETFDGHRFLADVLARGAWGALVDREVAGVDPSRLFRVPSTLAALGALARAHRMRWAKRLVTIGGSAGKTTTRSATSTLLEHLLPGRVHGTRGNLNNLVGVPMTLLGLEEQHDVAVVEVGTNQRGEVATLASVCQADVAVLTCIGLEHSEGLGDLAGVAAEEADLFTSMREPATLVGNIDDPEVARLLCANPHIPVCSYGQAEGAVYRIVGRETLDLNRAILKIQRKLDRGHEHFQAITRLIGHPGALATAAAFAAADALLGSVPVSKLETALDRDVGEAGRLRIVERADRALVIDDCYNANPASMRSSIAVAKEFASSRRGKLRLVLGDMLELGALSSREHAALADATIGAETIVAIGPEMQALAQRAEGLGLSVARFFAASEALDYVRATTGAGDVILIKGSRGMHLERIVTSVVGGEGPTA